eukprot:TRINITY_DN4221_c0_g1_i1.p1 TRINITY_DN4221_c0_g1~~TRINITY_DN4221_c0_g1_i1.p1  ORF type:complete len:587 (-),score=115.56 TRINITY_DN4221_c0_g1_i1:1455-3215(-)
MLLGRTVLASSYPKPYWKQNHYFLPIVSSNRRFKQFSQKQSLEFPKDWKKEVIDGFTTIHDESKMDFWLKSWKERKDIDLHYTMYSSWRNRPHGAVLSMLHTASQSKDPKKVLFVWKDIQEQQIEMDRKTFSEVLNAAIQEKNQKIVQDLADTALSNRNLPLSAIDCFQMSKILPASSVINMMNTKKVVPDALLLVQLSKLCTLPSHLPMAKQIEKLAIPIRKNLQLDNSLISMFTRCKSLPDAASVMEKILSSGIKPDQFTWGAILSAYSKMGSMNEVNRCYDRMRASGILPDAKSWTAIIIACKNARSLEDGKRYHSIITESNLKLDIYLKNALLDMYMQCGDIGHGLEMWDSIGTPDRFSWNSLLGGYVIAGRIEDAFDVMKRMGNSRLEQSTWLAIINGGRISQSKTIAHQIKVLVKRDIQANGDPVIRSGLVGLFVAFKTMDQAIIELEEMLRDRIKPIVLTWNSILTAYREEGRVKEAMELFERMKTEGIEPDSVTHTIITSIVKQTGSSKLVTKVVRELESTQDPILQNALLDSLLAVDDFEGAANLFQRMKDSQTVNQMGYTLMIDGFGQAGVESQWN